MTSARGLRTAMAVAIVGCSIGACADQAPTALVVAIQSEVVVPKEVDAVELKVTRRGGEVEFQQHYQAVEGGRVKLPGTLTLRPHPDESPSDPITVSLRAFVGGRVVALRRATMGFSEQRTKLLRMPIHYACYDFPSVCGDDETCVGGACTRSAVDAETLPDFEATQVFGAPGDATCFDAADTACLRQRVDLGEPAKIAAAGCVAELPAGLDASRLNVFALWRKSVDQGHPRVLDLDERVGFSIATGRVKLAPGLCEAMARGDVTRLSISSSCPTKTALTPLCGAVDAPVAEGTLADSACTRCTYAPPQCAAEVAALEGASSPLACGLACAYDGHIDSQDECAANRSCFEACVAPVRACKEAGTCSSFPREIAWANCLAKLEPEATRCKTECDAEGISTCSAGAP
jgi:hypothetical protein